MTEEIEQSWLYGEDTPKEPGWYAVIYCWEVQEGFFRDAHYWNGSDWDYWDGIPVPSISSHSFKNRESAEKWAINNIAQ